MMRNINYFQYLMNIPASEYTTGATLVIDIKHGHANIKFANDELKEKFDEIMEEYYKQTVDFIKFLKIASQLGLDVDGDTIILDLFITIRDQLDLE